MKNIKLLNKIAPCGTDLFDKAVYNVGEEVENAEAIMVRSAVMHEMEFDKETYAKSLNGTPITNQLDHADPNLYYGEDVTEEEAQKAAAFFQDACPDAEVVTLQGGQPVYYYIISME